MSESLESKVRAFAKELRTDMPGLRVGQSMFVALTDLATHLANEIRATEFDPYYDDAKIGAFLGYINIREREDSSD